jgi:hypothetical protein
VLETLVLIGLQSIHLSARMVNFHDPAVIVNDLCACAFAAGLWVSGASQNFPFLTVAYVKLSHTLVGLYM